MSELDRVVEDAIYYAKRMDGKWWSADVAYNSLKGKGLSNEILDSARKALSRLAPKVPKRRPKARRAW